MKLENSLFTEKEMEPLIKSISYNQESIIQSIIHLYLPAGKIQLDPCYNRGGFYKSGKIPAPDYKFDIEPLYGIKGDSRNLPLPDKSIESEIFDPPFITYPGKSMINRMSIFGSFRTYRELKEMYRDSLIDSYRVLKPGGILIVKCQDGTTGNNLEMVHIDAVILPCRKIGFREIDFFILLSKQRIERRDMVQRHSRKYHSYFIVFQKGRK